MGISAQAQNACEKPLASYTDVVARILRFQPQRVIEAKTNQDVSQAIRELNAYNAAHGTSLKLSTRGGGFSQGGQWAMNQGWMLDMSAFRQILEIDSHAETATVEPGVTWGELQAALNPQGLAVKVMQSSNVFTVGGSVGINCHGRDVDNGPLISTVNWIEIVDSQGRILRASRSENAELFFRVIGGLGVFGVVTKINLSLRPNKAYKISVIDDIPFAQFPERYLELVHSKAGKLGLAYGRLSVAPENFLKAAFIEYYEEADAQPPADWPGWALHIRKPGEEGFDRWLMALQRDLPEGRSLREILEHYFGHKRGQIESLNNAMNPAINFLLYRLEEENAGWFKRHVLFPIRGLYRRLRGRPVEHADILQEYFIPLRSFETFTNRVRSVVTENKITLTNVTLRYVPKNTEARMSYSTEDMVAFVLNFNVGVDDDNLEKARLWTQELAEGALELQGKPYLPYHPWLRLEQIERAYPNFKDLLEAQKHSIFGNEYLEIYLKP